MVSQGVEEGHHSLVLGQTEMSDIEGERELYFLTVSMA